MDINKIEIRMAEESDWEEAVALAWRTFLEFEAEDYGPEGTRSFQDFITDQTLKKMFLKGQYQMMVAKSAGKILGLITVRNENHISLLFVDKAFHRMGIGKKLIYSLAEYLGTENNQISMTVYAAPYAVAFYQKLGFRKLDEEHTDGGIRYTPMIFYI